MGVETFETQYPESDGKAYRTGLDPCP
jgi:hypothetical protein